MINVKKFKNGNVVFGAANSGKTAYLCDIARKSLDAGKSVMFVTFDDTTHTIIKRINPEGKYNNLKVASIPPRPSYEEIDSALGQGSDDIDVVIVDRLDNLFPQREEINEDTFDFWDGKKVEVWVSVMANRTLTFKVPAPGAVVDDGDEQ